MTNSYLCKSKLEYLGLRYSSIFRILRIKLCKVFNTISLWLGKVGSILFKLFNILIIDI